MILWLNGAFGSGKTQTAYELCRGLSGSYVYDPENLGFWIRDNIPKGMRKSDFQDYPVWRELNGRMLRYLVERHEGHLIVPMTITNEGYYREIAKCLPERYPIKRVILYASRETLLKRLASRLEGRKSWAAQQIDRCISAFDMDEAQTKIYTEHLKIRQVAEERGRQNVMFLHVSLIVAIPGTGELKSKPTQHSAKELLSIGIQPDVILCRSDAPVPRDILEKISLFCNIPVDHAIPNLTADLLYEVPLMLEREGLAEVVVRRLGLICPMPDLTEWATMVHRAKHPEGEVEIALVGKYVALHDAYLSVAEALTHAGIENGVKVRIRWVDSETVTGENAADLLAGCAGVLVPGGFGTRGVEGKISAVRYAREHRVPFLGICLGMQMAVVEFARHCAGLAGAHSSELDSAAAHPVIALLPDQVGVTDKGGTMRLGSYPCEIAEGSLAAKAYGASHIDERHRHRYEFNNAYRQALETAGLRLTGLSPDGRLVEIVELPGHPWFVGVQFHPELKSRPNRAHPLFREFVAAAKIL